MLNKLERFLRRYQMLQPGEHVVCAVSGGADSVALLFALFLLREKLQITLSAAHFNHHLRGEESDRDEAFVRELCDRYGIVLHLGSGQVLPGKKGLEAAARDARYTFLKSLPGKIATAHTADDNAETVLMHLIRGTGLRGLGAIAPVNGCLIRPMLGITRQEVLAFLETYHLHYISDSSNDTDQFLRNRLRHHVVPYLKQENPQFVENLSAMALRLRDDEQVLFDLAQARDPGDVEALRKMPEALRSRALSRFLEQCGVPEPEAEHIDLAQSLVFSDKPSAKADFPGGVVICRNYDRLELSSGETVLENIVLPCPGVVELPECGLRVACDLAQQLSDKPDCFAVIPEGKIVLRSRQPGDTIRLSGGTKSLKKLLIDHKVPAPQRAGIPVLADERGVLGVYGFGANKDRLASSMPAIEIRFERSCDTGCKNIKSDRDQREASK